MTITQTPPGAVSVPPTRPREATTPAERATRGGDWLRVTDHLGTLTGTAADNAWGVLGQYLESFLTQVAVPHQRVSAGQSTERIEDAA